MLTKNAKIQLADWALFRVLLKLYGVGIYRSRHDITKRTETEPKNTEVKLVFLNDLNFTFILRKIRLKIINLALSINGIFPGNHQQLSSWLILELLRPQHIKTPRKHTF